MRQIQERYDRQWSQRWQTAHTAKQTAGARTHSKARKRRKNEMDESKGVGIGCGVAAQG